MDTTRHAVARKLAIHASIARKSGATAEADRLDAAVTRMFAVAFADENAARSLQVKQVNAIRSAPVSDADDLEIELAHAALNRYADSLV